ncbi:MAG: choice-of-anchor Q domain-containing protein [Enhygromyxa sp.]
MNGHSANVLEKAAAEAGGVITFDCGPDPVTISLSETIVLPVDTDTIIDGEGLITLDAGGELRHFYFNHPDWMNNPNKLVLQRLRLINGQAPAGEFFPQDPQNPECAWGYKEGSGGTLYMRNGVLHVIDSRFEGNSAALLGPDVGGGAIYVVGVPEIIISGSSFVGNRGANGGAIGMLFAGSPQIYNSYFEDNTAEGVGQNYVEPGCPDFNHDEQGGAGGNSGAVYFDGLNDEGVVYEICGSVFRNNRANELGGALFRTPNVGQRQLRIDRCLFAGNTARLGGVSFIKDNLVIVRASTFMNNRSGVNVAGEELGGPLGGLWINNGSVDLENSTFYQNQPSGLDVEGSGGTVTNATFVASRPGGNFTIDNSLFVDTNCSASFSGVNNLQWPEGGNACVTGASFADPQVGAIAEHGGPTPTVMPGAVAAVAGIGVDCPPVDQRGEPRATESCAAGAVEP